MSSTYRDSAKKLDNLFDDFMKKVNTHPSSSSQSQPQQLHQSASQGLIQSNQNQRNSQNVNPYLNGSSPLIGTDAPLSDNRSITHSNSAFQLYSQQTGTSSNGFQGGPPLPWKQNTNTNQTRRKNSQNQIQQNIQVQQNEQQVFQENIDNQENLYEYDENNQYFHDTFQNIGGKDSMAQDSLPSTSHQNTLKPNNIQHQLSFNQKSIDGGESIKTRVSCEVINRVEEMFPPVHQIIRGGNHQNQENSNLNSNLSSNINNMNNYMFNPSNQGSVFQVQNSRQNMIFDTNQVTYGSQMASKRQATEGSIMMGYGTSISTTQRESKAYANAMKALQAKIRELQAQLEQKDKEMRNEREQQQDNIFNMQTIINEKEEEVRDSRRQFEEAEKQRKEMQVAFEQGDAEKTEIFERMEQDLSLLNTQLNESRNKQSKLKEELLSEKTKRQNLEEDLLQLQQESQENKRNLHQLQAEHRLLQDEKDDLNRKYQSEKMAKEEFQIKSESRQRDLQKMKEHYNEQLREFQNELNLLETNYSRKISDLEKRISVLQEENEEQKHLLDVKNAEIDQLQSSLYQKQSEWEDARVNLLAKQRKLVEQIHSLKQHKASSTISRSSSRRHLSDKAEEDGLLSSNKSRSQHKSTTQQVSKKSRNSSTSRSPTPTKSQRNSQNLPSFSNTTIAANSQRINQGINNFNNNNNESSLTSTKRSNNFNELAQTSSKSNNFSEIAQSSQMNFSQNIQKSPISKSKITTTTTKISQQQYYNNSQIQNNNIRSSSQSPPPQSRSPNHVSPMMRGHSQTLPSNNLQQQMQHQQSNEGTARLGVINQNNFDTPLFQNELLRDRKSKELPQQSGNNTIDYEQYQNAQEQQQNQVGQSTITQNDFENEEKMGGVGQNGDSFFYNQYIMGVASTNSNPNNQFNNNSNIINNSRLNVSQLQNYSQMQEQSQLNQSNNNNNMSYMQSQNTTMHQNTNQSTSHGQDINDKYEYILKQIIESEKESISLSSQFQNIINESQKDILFFQSNKKKTEDSKKKHENRGRLIELNEQIKKNNDKLFALKRKEQEFLDQMNGNF